MATEKNTPEIINGVKAQIMGFVASEIEDRAKYDGLKAAAKDTDKGSEEKKALGAFLKDRAERLGYEPTEKGGVNPKASQFSVTQEGSIKLALTGKEAKRLLETIETGKVPSREPSKLESWLASKPAAIKNPDSITAAAALKEGDKLKGKYIYISKDDVAKLPEGVRPAMKKGTEELDLTKQGDAQIYVSSERARNAEKIAAGKPLDATLSHTASLLRYNLETISVRDKDGNAQDPKDVIKKIAEGNFKTASTVYVNPDALVAAVDNQKNAKVLGDAFKESVKESINHSASRSIVIGYAKKAEAVKTAEAAKAAPAKAGAEIG